MSAENTEIMDNWVPETAVGAGSGMLAGFAAWIVSWRIWSARQDARNEAEHGRLSELFREIKDDLKATTSELRTVAGAFVKLQSEQNVINQMRNTALEGIVKIQERHEHELAELDKSVAVLQEARKEQTATMALLHQWMQRQEERP